MYDINIYMIYLVYDNFVNFIVFLRHVGGVSRTTDKSWMELFVTKVNGWKLLSFVTASSIRSLVVIFVTPLTALEIFIYYCIFLGAV